MYTGQENQTQKEELQNSFRDFINSNDFMEQLNFGDDSIPAFRKEHDKKEIINKCFYLYLYNEVFFRGRDKLLSYVIHNSAIDLESLKNMVRDCEWIPSAYAERNYGFLTNQFYRNCIKALATMAETDYSLIECLAIHESPRHAGLLQEFKRFLLVQDFYETEYDKLIEEAVKNCNDSLPDIVYPNLNVYMKKMRDFCFHLVDRRSDDNIRDIAYTLLYYIATDKTEREFIPMQILFKYVKRCVDKVPMYMRAKEDLYLDITGLTDWTDDIRKDSVYRKYMKKHMDNLMLQFKSEDLDEELSDLIIEVVDDHYWMKLSLCERECVGFIHNIFEGGFESFKEFAEKYYESEFLKYWDMEIEDREAISKLDILRYMPKRDYVNDLYSIIDLILEDQMYFYLRKSMEDYVEHHEFFTVPVDMRGLRKSYQSKVDFYKNEAEEYRSRLSGAEQRNEHLKKLIESNKNSAEIARQETNLEKQLEAKDKEIEELKKQLASQENYIDMLTTEVEEETEGELTYDLPALQGKRYLFFCYIESLTNELKKVFPNSKFVDNNRISLDGVKVDGVVVIVKGLKHSMYYKIRSVFQASDSELLMYNNNNLDRLYYEMDQMFLKE